MADYSYGIVRPDNTVSNALLMPELANSKAVADFLNRQGLYTDWWGWVTGEKLERRDPKRAAKGADDPPPLLYPLSINPIQWAVLKHAAALFGQAPEDADSLVNFRYRQRDKTSDELCERTADIINTIWSESHGAEIQRKGAYVSQFLGGAFYRVVRDPNDSSLTYGVRFESMMPDYILPFPDTRDPWTIHEYYMMYYIAPEEAMARYNIERPKADRVLYMEHWTTDEYRVAVGGETPTVMMQGMAIELKNRNSFGFVPLVYIPHLLRPSGFWGISHVPSVVGLVKELNTRAADTGDFVKENSYSKKWIRNVIGTPKTVLLPDGEEVVSLGSTMAGAQQPDTGRFATASASGESHLNLLDRLFEYIQHDTSLPPVAWGQDEGSQRSALTIALRMQPFTDHIAMERTMWREGFRVLNRMALKMMLQDGHPEVSEDMLKLKCQVQWFPMSPRDRKELVDEIAIRKANGIISVETGVQLLSQGEDVQQELEKIKADMEGQQKLLLDHASKPQTKTSQPVASTAGATED